MQKIGSVFISFLILFWFSQSYAVPKVTAIVSKNIVASNETFNLTVTASDSEGPQLENIRLPDIKQFQLVRQSGPNRTSRMSIINGQMTVNVTMSYSYTLLPRATGKITIPAIDVVVNGKAYQTQPIVMTVRKNKAPSAPGGLAGPKNQIEEDLFSRLLQQRVRPGFKSQLINPKEAFFIQVEVDKTKVFVGEQVTASWYIYTRGQIRDIDTLKYPSLRGFWKEDIEVVSRLNFKNEIINGMPYKKALLASYALFPIKKGQSIIDPYKAKCTVVAANSFGFGKSFTYTKASKEVKIEIFDIPKEDRPSDFSGAVGQFEVSTQVDSQEVPVNQPVSLKIRFEGKGNAKLIDLPPLQLPPSLELYDTKKESKFFKNGQSYKEFELLLIPRQEGEMEIPAVSVSVFDPDREKFYQRKTSAIKLNVLKGSEDSAIPSQQLADVDTTKTQKQYEPELIPAWEGHKKAAMNLGVVWSGIYIFIFGLLGWRFFTEFEIGQGKKNLNKLIHDRFNQVNQALLQENWREVGVRATNLIYYLLGEVSEQGGAHIEIDKLLLKLSPSLRRQLSEPLKKHIAFFEVIGFAPDKMTESLRNHKEIKKRVADLENLLLKAVKDGLGTQMGSDKSNESKV